MTKYFLVRVFSFHHTVEKWKIYSNWWKISSNHFSSLILVITLVSRNFSEKMVWVTNVEKRNITPHKFFSSNQVRVKFFGKTIDLTKFFRQWHQNSMISIFHSVRVKSITQWGFTYKAQHTYKKHTSDDFTNRDVHLFSALHFLHLFFLRIK